MYPLEAMTDPTPLVEAGTELKIGTRTRSRDQYRSQSRERYQTQLQAQDPQ